jgi:pimeloyl-ACP methyl ester carboxylesterase
VRRAHGLGRVAVLGHSAYSILALAYAARYPELTSHVLAIAGGPAITRTPPPAVPTLTTPAPGTQPETPSVPGYELVERLGEGGYGVVHRARDAAGVERAIKLLLPVVTITHENTRERFLREARALSRLDHRNLVKYLQLAEGSSGWYLIMELVRGSNLSRWAREHGHIERADVVAAALDGLAYMHEQRVIHRGLRVIVWAIFGRKLELRQHAGEDLQAQVLLIAQAVGSALKNADLLLKPSTKPSAALFSGLQ